MARPNFGKTRERISVKIHPSLKRLLDARREFLVNDGQKFAENASMPDISKEFVEHYWRLAGWTVIGKKMKKYYKLVPKSAKNI